MEKPNNVDKSDRAWLETAAEKATGKTKEERRSDNYNLAQTTLKNAELAGPDFLKQTFGTMQGFVTPEELEQLRQEFNLE